MISSITEDFKTGINLGNLVNSLQPDVLVKGGDYDAACTDENDPRYMVGSAELKAWGGHAVAVPLVPGQSTTATIKKIRTS